MSRDDFKSRMGTSVIVTGVNKDGTVEAKDAAKIWMGDNRRRTASKIVFTSRDIDHECFNLWTGFGVTPRAGSCKLIRRHIWEVICARDSTKYEAFVRLLAWQTQNIGCASRIVVGSSIGLTASREGCAPRKNPEADVWIARGVHGG